MAQQLHKRVASPVEPIWLSESEYLASELLSPIKREFIDSFAYPITVSGNLNHHCIAANLFRRFGNHLEGTPCATFMTDIKVKLGADYVYPDIVVDCSKLVGDAYFASQPLLIVEVLSRSTRKLDLSTKRPRYINQPSLQELVFIETDMVSVQLLRKDNHWMSEFFFLGDEIHFKSIGLVMKVEDIYERVDNIDMNEYRHAEAQATDGKPSAI